MHKLSLGALKINLITDVVSEPLSISSDCRSLQGPFNWVDNSQRIRRYNKVFEFSIWVWQPFLLVNTHSCELPRCSHFQEPKNGQTKLQSKQRLETTSI